MLEVFNVSKYFGAFAAVRNVRFTVRRGEVLGLFGRCSAISARTAPASRPSA